MLPTNRVLGYFSRMTETGGKKKTSETNERKRREAKRKIEEVFRAKSLSDPSAQLAFLEASGVKEPTARRVISGASAVQNDTLAIIDRLYKEVVGRSTIAGHTAVTAAVQARKSTPESLAALVEELSHDPADRKLVEMMLLIFRDS